MAQKRERSEASRKAGLLTAYFKAVEKTDAALAAKVKAGARHESAYSAQEAARQACADVGVKIEG